MLRAIILCAAVLAAAFLISGNISKNRAAPKSPASQGDMQTREIPGERGGQVSGVPHSARR